MKFNLFVLAFLLSFSLVSAQQVYINFGNGYHLTSAAIDPCNSNSYLTDGQNVVGFKIQSNCTDVPVEIRWPGELNLAFGPVSEGEFLAGKNWVFVDSSLRPDLDVPATIVFRNHGFIIRPSVLRDGVVCNDCVIRSFVPGEIVVDVQGFSNYSLSFAQDFTVYSDPFPELKKKTYQTIDLGDTHRNDSFACVVQIFGKSAEDASQWVLVQTNPTRDVQSRLFGSPDMNQPESLGYFPTTNGIANTYFRGDDLYAYNDLQLVVQCANDSQKLVYEESITTKYSPAGRGLVARGVWFTDGSNSIYVVAGFFGFIVVLWVALLIWRSLRFR
jgi:hypothetical protein